MGSSEKKRLIIIASLGLGLLVLVQFIIFPVLDYKDNAEEKFRRNEKRFARFAGKIAQYQRLVADRKVQAKKFDKGKGVLLGAVNGEAKRLNLTANLSSLKPGKSELPNGMIEDSVALRFDKMYLEHLIRFLHAMETRHSGVEIKSMSLARKNGNFISADVVLAMTMPE